jgi:YHS domain-containing protein
MEREVFTHPSVEAAIAANYVPVRLNVEQDGNEVIAQRYGLNCLPTDIVMTPQGRVLAKRPGYAGCQAYVARLQNIVTELRRQPLAAGPAQPGNAPPVAQAQPQQPNHRGYGGVPSMAVGGQPPVARNNPAASQQSNGPWGSPSNTAAPVNPALAGQRPDPNGQLAMNQPFRDPNWRQPGTQPVGAGNSAALGREYKPAPWEMGNTPPTPPQQQYNPAASQTQQQQPAWPRQQYNAPPQQRNMPAPTQRQRAATHPQGPPVQSQGPPMNRGGNALQPSAGNNAPAATTQQRKPLPKPPGTSPFALEGFCPVALAERETWKMGDLRYGVNHRGRTYLFTGPEEQKRFLKNPDRYAPVASGIDIVVWLDEGKVVPGKRQHGVFYPKGGRIYLFSTEESLQRFDRDPQKYLQRLAEYEEARRRAATRRW